MADKRLLDYDTTTEYANDDYILLDGANGTKKILVSSVAGGGGGESGGGNMKDGFSPKLIFTDLFTEYKQSSMTSSYDTSGDEPVFKIVYGSGGNVGYSLNGKFNLKDSKEAGVKSIKFKLKTGTCYDASAQQNIRPLVIATRNTTSTSYVYYNQAQVIQNCTSWRIYDVNYINQTIEGSLDISNLTGDIYLLIIATGWNVDIEEFELSTDDAEYSWYYNSDNTLIVRDDGSANGFRWYFNNVSVPTSPFLSVPSNLSSYILNNVGAHCEISNNQSYEEGVVGFYQDTIRLWTTSTTANIAGKVKGIVEGYDSNISNSNNHTWEDPVLPE